MSDHQQLVDSLSLPEKVTLLTGATAFTLAPAPSIGLGEVRVSDGPTGVRGLQFSGGREVALLPNATLLAASWDTAVAREVGELLAEEALAQQIHVVLGPTINLHRSPLGGRLFEAYSEDPLLTGKLAAAYVDGMQTRGVGACLKHLVANESETERNTMNSVVDEATLRELYLLPFEIALSEANSWSIMAAYNDVNGVAATEQDHVQNGIVKGEWGYDGLIMSDWFATKTAGPAANGGLDLVMPGPDGPWGQALVAAVEAGEVTESVIDDHLRRLLLLAERTGALGELRSYPEGLPAPADRREQLTRLAASGMTVLRNESALPLARESSVALIGRHAVQTICMGGGSAQVNPPYQVSVADGLAELLGEKVTVVDGVEVRARPLPADPEVVRDPVSGDPGMRVTILDADGVAMREVTSAAAVTLVGQDDNLPRRAETVRLRATVLLDGEIEVGVIGVGSWSYRIAGQEFTDRIDLTGVSLGEEVLRPGSSVRTVTVRSGDELTAEATFPSGMHIGLRALVVRELPRATEQALAEAVAAAREADVAVVVVGVTEEQETEAADKTTLALPGDQDALVAAVAAVARKTVVVVNAATPVLMPWLDQVDAVLWAGLPGQEGGRAVAAALLGDIEPAGRLVTSFPAADGAAPAWNVTPIEGAIAYTEGTFIGHRGYHAGHAAAPAFWFGHGLGYGSFGYGDATLDPAGPAVTLSVRNTSDRDSREVVQLYWQPATAGQPIRLVGWSSVDLAAGAEASVTVTADQRMWRTWNTAENRWDQLDSAGELLIARGLGDVRARVSLG